MSANGVEGGAYSDGFPLQLFSRFFKSAPQSHAYVSLEARPGLGRRGGLEVIEALRRAFPVIELAQQLRPESDADPVQRGHDL